jgi:hypothetical protein
MTSPKKRQDTRQANIFPKNQTGGSIVPKRIGRLVAVVVVAVVEKEMEKEHRVRVILHDQKLGVQLDFRWDTKQWKV